jgi:ankyrin repeat protein
MFLSWKPDVKMASREIPYATIKFIVSYNADTVRDLVLKRRVSQAYRDYIDNGASDVWVRAIKENDIKQAFARADAFTLDPNHDNPSIYVARQIMETREYYLKLTPQEREEKQLSDEPPVLVFPYGEYFVNRVNPRMDPIFSHYGFLNEAVRIFVPKYKIIMPTTALSQACLKGTYDEVKFLLEEGAEPNPKDVPFDQKPLYQLFVERTDLTDYLDIYDLLLDHNVDIQMKDEYGNNLLHTIASSQKDVSEKIDVLVQSGINVNERNFKGETPLYLACRFFKGGWSEKNILMLLDVDADPNLGLGQLYTCLRELLTNLNEDLNDIDRLHNNTWEVQSDESIDEGLYKEHLADTRMLLHELIIHGANPFIVNMSNDTIFSEVRDLETLNSLYDEKQADKYQFVFNLVNDRGQTCLMNAFTNRYIDICTWFINHGARPDVFYGGQPLIFNVIERYSQEQNRRNKYVRLIDAMLTNDNVLSAIDTRGQSVLLACIADMNLVRDILRQMKTQKRFDLINYQNNAGITALSVAIRLGNRQLIELLIDAGASTEIRNKQGLLPRDTATKEIRDYIDEVVARKLTFRNSRSRVPAERSVRKTYEDTINYLNDRNVPSEEIIASFLTRDQLVQIANRYGIATTQKMNKDVIINSIVNKRNHQIRDY